MLEPCLLLLLLFPLWLVQTRDGEEWESVSKSGAGVNVSKSGVGVNELRERERERKEAGTLSPQQQKQ